MTPFLRNLLSKQGFYPQSVIRISLCRTAKRNPNDQLGFNRFVELESRVFFLLMFFLNLGAFGRCTGVTFVDSTMIPVCHNLRRYANKVFKGIATDGKGTMGWCHGFKLHLACNAEARL